MATPPGAALDAVELEIIKASLVGIVQEMQNSLFRTGYSTIIRESQDASCAIMDAGGDVVAQHVVLPLHISSFPACCQAILRAYDDIGPGDAFIINSPYEGGSPHAPDLCVLTPVFVEGSLTAFTGSIAHKGDIGGPVPGSCSGQAREVFNEGLQLPALRVRRGGAPIVEVERIFAANSRTPELVLGDMRGQIGSGRLGEERLVALVAKFGADKITRAFERLIAVAEQRLRAAIAEWHDGRAEAERFVDDDGVRIGQPVRIHVAVEKRGDRLTIDFSGSDDQTPGPANIRPPLLRGAVGYCLIALVDPDIFINSGLMQAFDIVTRPGSVTDPIFPAPVNTYMPTVHACVEAIFAALAAIVPGKARADSCGTRSIILGGRRTAAGRSYVQYEVIGGGGGARATRDGASGTSVNQSNAKIAPVEIIESEFPTRVLSFELIRDSGGAGQFRGGLGIRREYLNLADARFSIRSSKHVIAPRGLSDGHEGRTGDILVNPDGEGEKRLPTRYADYPLQGGDRFRLDTPGGGGYGDPQTRDPQAVLDDVRQGYVSREKAASDYGIVLIDKDGTLALDAAATARSRATRDTHIEENA